MITKPQRLFSINELSDTLVVLIFDIHCMNAFFLFDWLVNVGNIYFDSLLRIVDGMWFAKGYSKLDIQPGYFEAIFLWLALMFCNSKSNFFEFKNFVLTTSLLSNSIGIVTGISTNSLSNCVPAPGNIGNR